jgi:hypothetical protein
MHCYSVIVPVLQCMLVVPGRRVGRWRDPPGTGAGPELSLCRVLDERKIATRSRSSM